MVASRAMIFQVMKGGERKSERDRQTDRQRKGERRHDGRTKLTVCLPLSESRPLGCGKCLPDSALESKLPVKMGVVGCTEWSDQARQ